MKRLTGIGIFLIVYQVLLVISLPFYFYFTPPKLNMIIVSIALVFITGVSVTAGYHRCYSHRAFNLNRIAEIPLLFFSTMALHGSVLRWCNDHRVHHRFTEQEQDPHSIKKGFWYAHMLWLFDKNRPIDKNAVHDLMQNKLIMFQHKHYVALAIVINAIAFVFIGWLLHDFIGAFFLSLWTRLFALHHLTWFINSLAHTWGSKTFSKEQTAADNYLTALLTFGEGYHNYHHVFASDYRNGVRWYHFDPTKWLIWTLSKMGLAKNLKQINTYTAKKRMILEDKMILLGKIKQSMITKKEELEQRVHQTSENLLTKISEINTSIRKYKQFKSKESRLEIKILKKSINEEWKTWLNLSQSIVSL